MYHRHKLLQLMSLNRATCPTHLNAFVLMSLTTLFIITSVSAQWSCTYSSFLTYEARVLPGLHLGTRPPIPHYLWPLVVGCNNGEYTGGETAR